MQKKYKLVHLYGPAFTTVGEQKYLLPGWIPVEKETTFNDVEHINPWKSKIKRFTVEGSSGNLYTVTKNGDIFSCDCLGGKFKGMCKHITKIKADLI